MERITIRGNKALAETLGVHVKTVQYWRNRGLLEPATLVDFGRVIIYDIDKVYECLRHKKVRPGRRVSV